MNKPDGQRRYSIPGKVTEWIFRVSPAFLLTWMILGANGCSGGPGGGAGAGDTAGEITPAAVSGPNVIVTVTDVFGVPAAGAEITLYKYSGYSATVVADASGWAKAGVHPDSVSVIKASTHDAEGIAYLTERPAGSSDAVVTVTVHPRADLTGGIAKVTVPNGGVADDGRSLDFNVRFYVVSNTATVTSRLEDWNIGPVEVLACVPDIGNDSPQVEADCVAGPAGFDASYTGSTLGQNWVAPGNKSAPLAVALLLDQGGGVIVNDPADRRLLAAKYLQTQLGTTDEVLLAAYASDDAASGQVALLQNTPVTLYPLDHPQFMSNGREYFSAIDSLATREGGASPFYASADWMIDFVATNSAEDARRAVVMLSSGKVDGCGTLNDCWNTQNALSAKSAAKGVYFVVVGLAGPTGQFDQKALGTFAQGESGATFWARDGMQVATVFGSLPAILDGRHGALDATFRLQSPVVGAFASGRTVSGVARLGICPWDCDTSVDIPFVVRIP